MLFRPHGKESTEVRKSQIKGKEIPLICEMLFRYCSKKKGKVMSSGYKAKVN